nr:helix-turn-helix domain-containing protein [Parabacteroides goldsteinii]
MFAQPKDTHGTTEGGEAGQLEEETSATVTETEVEVSETKSDEDYARFMKMESLLVEQKLFLKPGFGRDDLTRVAGINKNDLSPLLRKYADSDNFNDYLNSLKIEYSIKLMKEKPYLSVDAIAEEANFNSRSTFYRAFVKISGMTPAQYMRTKIE